MNYSPRGLVRPGAVSPSIYSNIDDAPNVNDSQFGEGMCMGTRDCQPDVPATVAVIKASLGMARMGRSAVRRLAILCSYTVTVPTRRCRA